MAYTDMTTTFESGRLFIWQDFKTLADNDAYKHLDSGTVMLFTQATAPTGWTKQTGFSNQALRVVDGSGGATGGGSAVPGGTISLGHTHTYSTTHAHALSSHIHDMTTEQSGTPLTPPTGAYSVTTDSDNQLVYEETSGSTTVRRLFDYTQAGSGNHSSDNAGTISNAISDITFKYLDSIIAVKD